MTALGLGAMKGWFALRRRFRQDGSEKLTFDAVREQFTEFRNEIKRTAEKMEALEKRVREEESARIAAERKALQIETKAERLEFQVTFLREQNAAQALQIKTLETEVVQLRAELATKQTGH